MKIGVFHPPFHPKYFGGSIAVTVPIVNSLAEQGYDVVLFVANRVDQKRLAERIGEAIHSSVRITLKESHLSPRSALDLYENAFNLLVFKQKCDVVIDSYSCYVFPWTDVCYVHFPYLNSYTFNRHFPYLKRQEGLLTSAIKLPYVFFEKNIERYDNKLLLANSNFTSKAIKDYLGATAAVLYPPISPVFFEHTSPSSGYEKREDLVVTIGRIQIDKKMETIIRIANRLRRDNVRFRIVGFSHNEEVLDSLNSEIKKCGLMEKVSILTDVSREQMKDLMRKAKVYLHTPTLEHFGMSIAEAMAMGCLPVVYDDGGAREFVPEELRYRTLEEAAEKVKYALSRWSTTEGAKMRQIAMTFSEAHFRRNFISIFSAFLEDR